jgi:hypothetical protein
MEQQVHFHHILKVEPIGKLEIKDNE